MTSGKTWACETRHLRAPSLKFCPSLVYSSDQGFTAAEIRDRRAEIFKKEIAYIQKKWLQCHQEDNADVYIVLRRNGRVSSLKQLEMLGQ